MQNLSGDKNNEILELKKQVINLEQRLAQAQRSGQDRVLELEQQLAREQRSAQEKIIALEQKLLAEQRKAKDLEQRLAQEKQQLTNLMQSNFTNSFTDDSRGKHILNVSAF